MKADETKSDLAKGREWNSPKGVVEEGTLISGRAMPEMEDGDWDAIVQGRGAENVAGDLSVSEEVSCDWMHDPELAPRTLFALSPAVRQKAQKGEANVGENVRYEASERVSVEAKTSEGFRMDLGHSSEERASVDAPLEDSDGVAFDAKDVVLRDSEARDEAPNGSKKTPDKSAENIKKSSETEKTSKIGADSSSSVRKSSEGRSKVGGSSVEESRQGSASDGSDASLLSSDRTLPDGGKGLAASDEASESRCQAAPELQENGRDSSQAANRAQKSENGTNEIFIRSSAFDHLRAGIEIEPPVVHAFEGTNEVYVRSSAFDAIRDDLEQSDSQDIRAILGHSNESSPRLRMPGIKVKPPVLPLKSSSNDSNIIGIIGSGILPSVDTDKSFDVPVLDEGVLERTREHEAVSAGIDASGSAPKKGDSLAVYASRMNAELGTHSRATGLSGLPTRDEVLENASIHPENVMDASANRATCARFAIDHAFDPRLLDIFHADLEHKDRSHETVMAALAGHLIDVRDASSPQGVAVESPCILTQMRVVRRFLNQCVEGVPGFSCYVDAVSPNGAPLDLVTALVSSRIGCFPDDPEETKNETLIRNASAILEQSDLRWGLDILLVRYGLGHMLLKRKGNEPQQLEARSASDMRELFLNIVAQDAKQGPVVIVLSTETSGRENNWRDVYSWLSKLASPNILLLFVGPKIDWSQEVMPSSASKEANVEPFEIPPLSKNEVQNILGYVFGTRCIQPDTSALIAEKSCGRFDYLRKILIICKNRGVIGNSTRADDVQMVRLLNSLGTGEGELDAAFVASFDEETADFLSWASLLGRSFYLNDLIQLMDLEPLPDEPIWSHPLRTTWCEDIAKNCQKRGILVHLSTDEKRGMRCCLPDGDAFCHQMGATQPDFSRQIHGCYAQLLAEQRPMDDAQIALHYESAQMALKAVERHLACARRYFDRFENSSTITSLAFCLSHIGPESGAIYADVLALYADLCTRIGEFDDARQCCLQRLAFEKYSRNRAGAVQAMIVHGSTLRIVGEYADSQRFLLKSVELAEELGDAALISDAYAALSALVFEMGVKGALVNGLRYAEKALEIQRSIGDLVKISEIQTLCARIYMLRGEPERARDAASEAYHGYIVSQCWHKTPSVLVVMAECAVALNEGLPLDFIERGMEIVEKTGNVVDRFSLLSMRVRLMMTTLERTLVRNDMDEIADIVACHPCLLWQTQFFYLKSLFDYSRKNFKKTTRSLRLFFDAAQRLGNAYLISCGYDLSAELNLDVLRRKLGTISSEKTEKLHHAATSMFESVGAWHKVAESLRHYAAFLDYFHRTGDAQNARLRADKVDPYCQ